MCAPPWKMPVIVSSYSGAQRTDEEDQLGMTGEGSDGALLLDVEVSLAQGVVRIL